MKNNPFEELSIAIKPKSLFQAYSYEANQVEVDKRIEALARIIYAGYNLREVVDNYLQGKDALNDKVRKNEIIDTFNLYTHTISDKVEENEPKKLQDAINAFVIAIKERFTIKDLLITYFENSQDYSALSSAIGIDLREDINKQLRKKDEKENSQLHWKYAELYSWFKEVLIPNIQNNNIRYWLPSLQMPATQIANVFIKKYLPIEDHESLKANAELRKERLYEFAEKVIRVLWLNEPLFEEPIYLVRCNYTGKSPSE